MQNLLKSLAYRPELIKASRALGLSHLLRNWYFRLAAPKGGVLELHSAHLEAHFRVHTPEELRVLESWGGGEQTVLERLLEDLPADATVFDVGANLGLYTIFLAKAARHGRVFAFEPNEQNYRHLLSNVELNELTNVRCVKKALGETSGEGRLVQGDIIGNYSLLGQSDANQASETVEIISGDAFAGTEKIPVPYLIKVDVEGFEYAVLRGMQSILHDSACRMVCVEVHPYLLPKDVTAESVVQLLRSAGFSEETRYERARDFHLITRKTAGRNGTTS